MAERAQAFVPFDEASFGSGRYDSQMRKMSALRLSRDCITIRDTQPPVQPVSAETNKCIARSCDRICYTQE